ncbi:MAG: hypothetical protein U1E65_03650 [Myxococcota bacterium]
MAVGTAALLQGSSGGGCGSPPLSECTSDGVVLRIKPGDKSLIPICPETTLTAGQYYNNTKWTVDQGTFPSWLTLVSDPMQLAYVLKVDASATVGDTTTQTLFFKHPSGSGKDTVNVTVEVRNPNIVDLQVDLEIVDPQIVMVGDRTIVPKGVDLLVQATRVLGDLHDFTGNWTPEPGNGSMKALNVAADVPTQYAQGAVKFTAEGMNTFSLKVAKVLDPTATDEFKSQPVVVKAPGMPVAAFSYHELYVGAGECFPGKGVVEPTNCSSYKLCLDGSQSRDNWQVEGTGALTFTWSAPDIQPQGDQRIVVCKDGKLKVTLEVTQGPASNAPTDSLEIDVP